MSMERKRLGAGLVGGLLLGLLIVGSVGLTSGYVYGLSGTFGSSASAVNQNEAASTASSVTSSTTSLGVYPISESTYSTGVATSSPLGSNETHSVSSSTSQTQSQSIQEGSTAPSAHGPVASLPQSSLQSIANQPAVDNGIVLLPVLVAIMLGALLYRVSIGSRRRGDEEPEAA